MTENEISKIIFDCALKVHKVLGPGLLESSYEECLYYELQKSGLSVAKQKPLPLIYDEVKLEIGYRVDLLVENKVIIGYCSAGLRIIISLVNSPFCHNFCF